MHRQDIDEQGETSTRDRRDREGSLKSALFGGEMMMEKQGLSKGRSLQKNNQKTT